MSDRIGFNLYFLWFLEKHACAKCRKYFSIKNPVGLQKQVQYIKKISDTTLNNGYIT